MTPRREDRSEDAAILRWIERARKKRRQETMTGTGSSWSLLSEYAATGVMPNQGRRNPKLRVQE